MDHERFTRGAEIARQLDGGNGMLPDIDKVDDLGKLIYEFAMGDVYSRPGISMRERLIVTITTVAAIGGADKLLRSHMARAMKNGITRKELEEIIMQIVVYAGFPRAVLAKQTLDTIED